MAPNYKYYNFIYRGSDERQYNALGVDLLVCSVCCSKYHEYPEYHTSADGMTLISPEGLARAYSIYKKIIEAIEFNTRYDKFYCVCRRDDRFVFRG